MAQEAQEVEVEALLAQVAQEVEAFLAQEDLATSEPAIDRTWQKENDSFVMTAFVLTLRVLEQTYCYLKSLAMYMCLLEITGANVGVVV